EPSMVQTIVWPTKALPPGAMREVSKVLPVQGQPARRATHAIAAGEILLGSKLSDYGGKVTIVQSLADNARAMAIQVNAATAVGGFVTPGDRVDIILTQGRDAGLRALTILQNIRVIGVDQDADPNRDKPEIARTVTVEVTPEQGQTLALAQNAGMLSLALRTAQSGNDKPLEAIRLS
ncbi:Flp pilus assembly protein CpaB, partial [Thioclava sp. BHET1]